MLYFYLTVKEGISVCLYVCPLHISTIIHLMDFRCTAGDPESSVKFCGAVLE